MRRPIIGSLSLFLFLSLATLAQGQIVFRPTPTPRPTASPTPTPEPRPPSCPNVMVQAAPNQPVRDGKPVSFILNIQGGDQRSQPNIVWSTTAGAIAQGQYTRKIDVDTTGAGASYDRTIKADVWVGGYAPECVLQGSASVKVIPPASKFGEFGEVPQQQVTFNLKTLTQALAESQDNLFIIGYAGRKSERNFTLNWLRRLKDELVIDGVDARRVNAMDGGFREDPAFEFWIVPQGAELPRPTPTVRRDEIVYPKIAPTTLPTKKPGG